MKKLLLFLLVIFAFSSFSNKTIAATTTLTYSSPNVYTVGVAMTLTPSYSNGAPTSVTVTVGTLPTGLSINSAGVISGTPSVVAGAVSIRVRATNASGNTNSNTFTIQIVAAATLSYSSPAAYTPGVAITPLSPTSSGVAANGFGTGVQLTGATLSTPEGMAIDASGNIYVTNFGNNTISKYNSSGVYQSTFGSGATLSRPAGIAFDASGNVYVLNRGTGTGNGTVFKYNSAGVYQSTIITGLSRAFGIATDGTNLYVADENAGRVYKYSTAGALLLTINTNLNLPWGVTVDASGNIYVINEGNGRVTKYNSAGTFQSNFATGFTQPFAIYADASGNIYVGDTGTGAVYEYSSSGTLLATEAAASVVDPEGMVVDSKGNLYVSDETNNTVYKYPPAGGYFITSITGGSTTLPAGLSFNSSTGTLSGTPTSTFTATTITVTAYNSVGTAVTASFTISCSVPAPILAYAGTPYSYTAGISNTTVNITNTGGAVSGTYTLTITSGALPAGVTFDNTTGTFTVVPTAAGSFTGNVTASNSGGGGSAAISMTVTNPAAPNISYSTNTYNVVYGTTINATVSNSGGPVGVGGYSVTAGTLPTGLTLNTTTGAVTGVPSVTSTTTVTITATNLGGTSNANLTFTVTPAPLTITATGPLKQYGTALTSGSSTTNFSTTALVNGESVSSVTLTQDANGLSATTAVGQPYVVTPSAATGGGTFNASNYSITYVVYNGTVTARAITITANNQSKTYGTAFTFTGTEFSITSGSLLAGDAVTSVTLTSAGAASGAGVAGSPYSIVPSAAVGTGLSNYTITYSNGTFTVGKQSITISATGPSKTYGTALTSGTYTTNFSVTSGTLAPGDAITSVVLTMNANAQSTTRAAGLSYVVTPSGQIGLTASNYTITYAAYNGTVAKANLTITASTNNKTYGTALTNGNITTGFIYPGIQNGETIGRVAAVYGTGAAANAAVGTYAGQITISGAAGGTFTASNYNITYVAGDIVVGQATLTITANSVTKTFGNTLTGGPGSTAFTTTGLATGETVGSVTITYGTGGAAGDAVGSYPNQVVPSAATGGTFNPANYNIVYVSGTITVRPVPPVISYVNPSPYLVGTTISPLTPTATGVATTGTYAANVIMTSATGNGSLNGPYGTAVDASGNFYVTNFSNNTITEYSTSGTITVTSLPSGSGPTGIVFDSSGNAYVVEQTLNKVVKYTGGLSGTASNFETGLNIPTGIAIDASGNIYVANVGNNKITKYAPAGGGATLTITANFLLSIDDGIAVDPSGNIYVADNNNIFGQGFVDVYNAAGTYVTSETGFGNVGGLATDSSGDIFIADNGAGTVYEYSSGFASNLLTETGLNNPEGVVADAAGNFYVADFNANTVTEYSPTKGYTLTGVLPPGLTFDTTTGIVSGTPQTVFSATTYTVTAYNTGGSGTATFTISCGANPPAISYSPSSPVYTVGTAIASLVPGLSGGPLAESGYQAGTSFATGLNQPWGLFADAAGNIWVAQSGVARVVKYTSAGAATTFTVAATGNTGVVVDGSGNFYVSNANGRIYKYGPTGTLLATNSTIRNFSVLTGSVDGLAIDAAGNIYAADNGDGIVWKYTASTGITSQLFYASTPVGLQTDPVGDVIIVDQGTNKALAEYNYNGISQRTIASGYNTAYSVYRDANGNYYVGDAGTNTVKGYNNLGTALGSFSATNPRGITADASGNLYVTNYTAGTITKYAPFYYVLTGNGGVLPPGITFDQVSGQFTGTPTAAFGPVTYTITVNGSDGGPASTTVTITCAFAPVFTYASPQTYIDNVSVVNLVPTITQGGPLTSATVTTNGPLPTGLTLNPDGSITGTPTIITGPITYTITGTNAAGLTGTATVTITCNPQAPVISYVTPDIYNINTAITPLTPANSGGPATSWTVSTPLPAGLSLDPLTGVISGTPTVLSPIFPYTITAANVTGSSSFTVSIAVISAAPVIAYTSPVVYTVGVTIAPLTPANTGGPVSGWSVSPALPAGLSIDNITGTITGTPTAATLAANYTVTATGAGGTGTAVVNITVNVAGPVLTYTTPNVFPVALPITPLTPANTGTTPVSYAISPGLPAGLSFDTTTGIISGTPTATSAAATYTITATDASSNTGTATVSIACTGANDWVGGTSTDWNDPTNWALGTVPTATDVAAIGVNVPFTNFPTVLTGAGTINVGSIVIGLTGGQAGGVIVSSGSTLAVGGSITYQSDSNAALLYTATLSGAGSITAAGLNQTANTYPGTSYNQIMSSSVNSLVISGNLTLTSTDGAGHDFMATFNVTGGTTSIGGSIQTNNGASSTSVVSVNNATLQLAGGSALSGLSGTGTNTLSFNNAGATVEYSGAAQTYYTDATITGLAGGVAYRNIKFSGTGVKTPNGTNANNLKISGDFTNALTANNASNYINLTNPQVNFNGTSQNIYGGNGTGTKFYNVTIGTTGTTTIQNGSVAVSSAGVLTMSGSSAILAAGTNLLTLNSDVNGTATVAAIPTGCSITGTVNVQRFITGGAYNYRGYRLVSSPVYGSNNGTSNIYSLNYLINSVYLKGSGGVAGGWDAGGNPNIFLFRENLAGTNQTFSSGNFRSLATIGTAPNYSYMIDSDGGPYNVPVGNGYMFFFRGDRGQASLTVETSTTYIPTNATLTATGILNQGQIAVSDWYTPTSTNLGWTTTAGNAAVQGYNLVGNPYASSIDWDTFQGTTSTNGIYGPSVNPFIYIIDPVSNNYNVYQQGNGGLGTILPSGSNVIASGQGFFVRAANASAQLVFNESAKINTQANATNGNLLMAHGPMASYVPQYLHLKIQKDSINTDGIIISFRSNTSATFNPMEDAPYRNGNGQVSLASMSADNVSLAINSMPLPNHTGQTVIPLNVSAMYDGTYTLSLNEAKAIPTLFTIWLKDAYRKDSLDIRNNPSYVFDVMHSDTNTYGAHRFSLVMGENPALMIHLLSFGASKVQGGDQVVWTTENEQNYTNFVVERSTDNGTTFTTLSGFESSAQSTYSYLDKLPANGANQYRLKITDINGAISYSKVVTIMYSNTSNQIALNGLMLYPNPTSGTINLSITNAQAAGTAAAGQNLKPSYKIEIVNNLGSVVKSTQSSSAQWQTNLTALAPGTYFIQVVDNNTNTLIGKSPFVKL